MRIVFAIFLTTIICVGAAAKFDPSNQWKCADKTRKEIILLEKVCDGFPDCSDKSDEDETRCRDVQCPRSAFRCGYGACVPMSVTCDKKEDCMDGTDESKSICPEAVRTDTDTIRHTCREGMWACENGECIDKAVVCDGAANCTDASDENKDACFSLPPCSPNSFRCSYGACIQGRLKCNKKPDCHDGSDEINCVDEKPGCYVEPAEGTIYEVNLRGQWTKALQRMELPVSSFVKMTCEEQFALPPVKPNKGSAKPLKLLSFVCKTSGTFIGKINATVLPRCLKNCSLSTSFHRNYEDAKAYKCVGKVNGQNDILPSCDNVEPGTKMTTSCKENFVPPTELTNFKTTARCMENGKWAYLGEFRCIPECGRPKVDHPVERKRAVKEGEYPWHAVLYRKEGFQNIRFCSGSIIAPDLIITAAHCVADENLDDILVGVGTITIQPNGELRSAQMIKLDTANLENPLPEEYIGKRSFYSGDIAVLLLRDDINLNQYARPICVDWKRTPFPFREYETKATFVSYGESELEVTSLRYARCDGGNVPADKFCAVFNNDTGGSTATNRNGGSGFVMRAGQGYSFLYGVLSKQPGLDSHYATFTNVSSHMRWLKELKYHECCT